ncbi:hypothetical protein [Devosia nitrariae]|nr:hypothetical protein [Devosia nitrariae]
MTTSRDRYYPTTILAWRAHVDAFYGDLAHYDRAPAVRTMLFACISWLNTDPGDTQLRDRIQKVKDELETWLSDRGEPYLG